MEALFEPGQYVRCTTEALGTGQVFSVTHTRYIDAQNAIQETIRYDVVWLDRSLVGEGAPPGVAYPRTSHAHNQGGGTNLAPSSRAVPAFESVEAAEAWMNGELGGGNWTKNAQDMADSVEDARSAAATTAIAQTLGCGPGGCGCLDCMTIPGGEHIISVGCDCDSKACTCTLGI